MSVPENRRETPRYPTNTTLRYRHIKDGHADAPWLRARVLSAGVGGLFLKVNEECPVDDGIEVEIPFSGNPVTLKAHVTWASRNEENGIGIQFESITAEQAEQLMDDVTSGAWFSETEEG